MGVEFVYEIHTVEFITPKRVICEIAPLAQILLVAKPLSKRIGSLRLAIRFRTIHDAKFAQIELKERIKRAAYPAGYDTEDPARLIARESTLRLTPYGMYTFTCGKYELKGRVAVSLDPFLVITRID